MNIFKKVLISSIWLLLISAGFLVYFFFDTQSILNWENITNNYKILKNSVSQAPFFSAFLYFLIYIFVVIFSLPFAIFLTVLAGTLFGWLAVIFLLLSTTTGCFIVFLLAKSLLKIFYFKKYENYIQKIKFNFEKSPFLWLLTIRFFPFLPPLIVNALPAIFEMKNYKFIVATFIGIIPGTLIYVSLGISLDSILLAGNVPEQDFISKPKVFIPLLILFFLSLITLYLKLIYKEL